MTIVHLRLAVQLVAIHLKPAARLKDAHQMKVAHLVVLVARKLDLSLFLALFLLLWEVFQLLVLQLTETRSLFVDYQYFRVDSCPEELKVTRQTKPKAESVRVDSCSLVICQDVSPIRHF
ncbi:MAG: hypothetical protein COX34_00975 [Candidatus Nealsonbacteria bacterium CG23_combo_of_CG06-09_8_20_14_all_36_12]|uniref:Uncharacterized protein n=1 Tax=Candidatus Nealsonbacteria bacterium CG23_combo_of_CG06-09_8_20_14_all_36_12 TaxID=1974718 RepID=A0A2G9Z0J6_9BACT|nr:MAG: hypothetical protein COX34_00975 [Candidatus Nealsonbacteria bacterium CG23_combo_of_CG06-09_8_20_14_all_36_12]